MDDYRGMSYEQASREADRIVREDGWWTGFDRLARLHKIMSQQKTEEVERRAKLHREIDSCILFEDHQQWEVHILRIDGSVRFTYPIHAEDKARWTYANAVVADVTLAVFLYDPNGQCVGYVSPLGVLSDMMFKEEAERK